MNAKIIKTCLEEYQIMIRKVRTEFASEIQEFEEFKKLLVIFKRLWKHNKKQLRSTKNQQTEEQNIKFTVNIKEKKIQILIDNASNISYMNSQLWWSLEIKKKEWR